MLRDMASFSRRVTLRWGHMKSRLKSRKYGLKMRFKFPMSLWKNWGLQGWFYWDNYPYTYHRANLIIRSVFAAYFHCEILHLAYMCDGTLTTILHELASNTQFVFIKGAKFTTGDRGLPGNNRRRMGRMHLNLNGIEGFSICQLRGNFGKWI